MKIKYLSFSLLLIFFLHGSFKSDAQVFTYSDINILEFENHSSHFHFSDPKNLTNRDGYDNHPSFTPDSKGVTYVSAREDNQTDIYFYDFATKTSKNLLSSPENEFSPMVMPDGKNVSFVRVEKDGSQKLWKVQFDGKKPATRISDLDSVGYYCWITANTIAICRNTAPASLIILDLKTNKSITVASNIGRTIRNVPAEYAISYVDKSSEPWMIKKYDLRTEVITPLVPVLETYEHYTWTADCFIFTTHQSDIYYFDPLKHKEFDLIEDLITYKLHGFRRIEISPDGKQFMFVNVKKVE